MKPAVEIFRNKLPPFWDRNVLFFCNLQSVFYDNQEAAEQLVRQISGAQSYGGRVVCILNLLFRGGPNKVILEAAPEPNLLDYLSGDLQLSLPTYQILESSRYQSLSEKLPTQNASEVDVSVDELRNHPAAWIDGYITDEVLVGLATKLQKRTISTLEGSRRGNNKYLLHLHQLEKNLPTFDTFLAASRDELPSCLNNLRKLGYKNAVVKAQIGASGYGMLKLPTRGANPKIVPDYLFFEGRCMVQGWLDQKTPGVSRIGSPSVQISLNDETIFLFDWTEQILSEESVHEGNMSPPPYISKYPDLERELFRQAAFAGEWLHNQGYRGTASVDFIVIERNRKMEAIICEINARVTGATYPSILARHFNPGAYWNMRNIQFRKSLDGSQLLSVMDRAAVLYRPGQDKGIVPFNFVTDDDGKVTKGQFLCLGPSLEECSALLARAWAELPVEWGYDRD
jgi:hypothetical protein